MIAFNERGCPRSGGNVPGAGPPGRSSSQVPMFTGLTAGSSASSPARSSRRRSMKSHPVADGPFPYRKHAKGPDDFLYCYDKIPVERVVLGDPDFPARSYACRWSTAPAIPIAAFPRT